MINLFDSIVQSHRREVAASLKAGAGAFDEWDVKQVDTIFGYLFYNPGIPMSWGCEDFAVDVPVDVDADSPTDRAATADDGIK